MMKRLSLVTDVSTTSECATDSPGLKPFTRNNPVQRFPTRKMYSMSAFHITKSTEGTNQF